MNTPTFCEDCTPSLEAFCKKQKKLTKDWQRSALGRKHSGRTSKMQGSKSMGGQKAVCSMDSVAGTVRVGCEGEGQNGKASFFFSNRAAKRPRPPQLTPPEAPGQAPFAESHGQGFGVGREELAGVKSWLVAGLGLIYSSGLHLY